MDVASILKLTQSIETGYGFFLLGCFSRVLNVVGMLLVFVFCMKILFGWHSKGLMRYLRESGAKPRNGVCLKKGVSEVRNSKISPFKRGSLKSSQNPNLLNKNNSSFGKENENSNGDTDINSDALEVKDDSKREVYDEDEEFDVMTLRKLVKIERQRARAAYAELEKERTAAASAAEEAMAMILRLQSEKSSVEIQANQFRRMAEQKLEYDQAVIESLQWIITQHESQSSLLEDQLMLYREKLKQYMREDEIDQFEGLDANRIFSNFSVEDDLELDSQTF